jgi:hypothetical protein
MDRDGEKNEKAQCTTLYVRDSNKEKLSKIFDQSWGYFLARFRGFEGYEQTKNEYAMDDFSPRTFREP